MRDPRLDELAKILITYSTKVQPGEVALIDYAGEEAKALAEACAEQVVRVGGVPLIEEASGQRTADLLRNGTEAQVKRLGEVQLTTMKECQIYIGIRGSDNIFEMQGVPAERVAWYTQHVRKPVHLEQRVKRSKWVVLRYPNPSMAQLAEKNTRDFADFYFKACCLDWPKMAAAADLLKKRMEAAKEVRIVAPETDLSFSIADIPVVPCAGEMNVPDGEVFTAPVRDSLNGTVRFNCKTTERSSGTSFQFIKIKFENGKAVELETESADKTAALNEILDRDEGSRYIGEFAIGFHPIITDPMNDILFDEKICGSWHMALGQCYDEAPNGNQSTQHWDLVQIQRPEYGGGSIFFDGEEIRKDGLFLTDDLQPLNPENLK